MSPRPRLGRTAVLDAALATIDRETLHGLTIRALAAELGVPTMTLYSYFKTKKELLDLTFEHLLHRLVPAQRHARWQPEFEAICRHMRRELLDHPHRIALLTRTTMPPSVLRIYDRLLHLMVEDGFEPDAAMFAFSSAMSLVLGSVLVERMMDGTPPVPVQRLALIRGLVTEATPDHYPHALAASRCFDKWSFNAVFDFELHSLLTGLEGCALNARSSVDRPRSTRRLQKRALGHG